jgi:hypothetical protein
VQMMQNAKCKVLSKGAVIYEGINVCVLTEFTG